MAHKVTMRCIYFSCIFKKYGEKQKILLLFENKIIHLSQNFYSLLQRYIWAQM